MVHAVVLQLRDAGLRAPKSLTLSLTGSCNLRCMHCWVSAGGSGASGNVPTQALHRLVSEFAEMGGRSIRFTGGEPLCHPDLLRLMQVARERGFDEVSLQTNAILLAADDIALLREMDYSGLDLQISMDGATAAAHDLVRGAGAYAGAMASIRSLVDNGLARRITLSFTEMQHNLGEFPDLLNLADAMGLRMVRAGTLVRGGRVADECRVSPPDADQYLELLHRYDADPVFRERYARIGSMAALEWRIFGESRREGCTFAEHAYLAPDGRLYPCVMCRADDFSVPGVLEKELAHAFAEGIPSWSSLVRISERRRRADGCHGCPGRLDCDAGCMGRAWGACGDLSAVDDRCSVRRIIYQRFKSDHPAC